MKKGKRWLLVSAALLLMLVSHSDAVAPFKKVSIATTTASTTSNTTANASSTTEEPTATAVEAKSENSSDTSTKSKLTGIPQIDWIWDPNLPRELGGYNLSSYPFFSTVPPDKDIHFKCDGLHDGFYASIEFKCQVYHHCVYGIRHDFLCANFTAFDQKTFICHFVSDVDCEHSQKYWSRNDALYMATTAKPTTTTTIEPPPMARRRPIGRPYRPLRRPMNRRPADDYYYDDEVYDDDYYEERLNRRRKQRPRQRKPVLDYEEEYEDKRSFSDDEKPRRPSSRDRLQAEDESEDDYDADRRKYDRPKSRTQPNERRKMHGRKPGSIGNRSNNDERRSFSDDRPTNGRKDKPKPVEDEIAETEDLPPRRLAGRRRTTDKRTSTADAADEEDPVGGSDQQGAADEEAQPKVKTTPKPLEEFVTPKAAPSSVFARPRAPPRIMRPVPINEKKKFQYAVQRTATTVAPAVAGANEEEDYYEDELYDDVRPKHGHPRRRIVDDAPIANKYDEEDENLPHAPARRRGHNDVPPPAGRKPTRTTLRKPVTEKKHLAVDDEEYDNAGSASNERSDSRSNVRERKRPYSSRNRSPLNAPSGRGSEDVDFVDDEYEEQPITRPAHRLRPNAHKNFKKSRPTPPPPEEEEEDPEPEPEAEPERPLRNRGGSAIASRRKNLLPSKRHKPQPSEEPSVEEVQDETVEEETESPKMVPSKPTGTTNGGRPTSVRVVKRPFLPSRGGSPYLPRGLQPVGQALKSVQHPSPHTTDSSPVDMGSTISGVRLLEHGAPLLRDSGATLVQELQGPPRTTLPPRSPLPIAPVLREERQPAAPEQPPKVTLDELYENDYDVTLNDALNPTLKPLPLHQSSNHNRNYQSAFAPIANAYVSNQSPAIHHNNYQQHSNAYQVVPQPQQTQTLSAQPHQSHQQQQQQPQQSSNYNSDSYFSSTDIRRRAINPAAPARSSRTDYRDVGTRIAQHFYDDIEYN